MSAAPLYMSRAGQSAGWPPTYFQPWVFNVVAGSLVTITEDADNSQYSFFSAYDSALNIADLSLNYLADAGGSSSGYTFTLFAPASGQLVLVSNSVSGTTAVGQLAHATIQFDAANIPEPASLGLLAIGVLGSLLVRRRQQSGRA